MTTRAGRDSSDQVQVAMLHTTHSSFPTLSASVAIRFVSRPASASSPGRGGRATAARKSAATSAERALLATRTDVK